MVDPRTCRFFCRRKHDIFGKYWHKDQEAHDNVQILAHFSLWLCLCCSFLDAYRLRTVDLFWDAAGEGCKVQLKEAIEKFEDKLLEQLQAQMKGLETALGSEVMDTLQEGLKNKEDLKKPYLQMQEEERGTRHGKARGKVCD